MPGAKRKTQKSKVKTYKKEQPKPWYLRYYIFAIGILIVIAFLLSPYADFNPQWQAKTVLKSKNGELSLTLNPKESSVDIGGRKSKSVVYNNSYLGDTWDIKGGDTVKVHLKNDLTEPTNLHFHGSHVSPKGHSDNVLVSIDPKTAFDYEYHLPKNHPPGLYWYHPHYHPHTDDQVGGGMAGAIIVRGDIDEKEGIKGVPERMMVLTAVEGNDMNQPERLVNGQKNPTMYLRPGQTVRMQVVNASADDFYNFAIPGHTLHIFSRDGNTTNTIVDVQSEVLGPGQRIEFLFTPTKYGDIPVVSLPYDQGFLHYAKDQFMMIRVQGFPMLPTKLPTDLERHEDFRNAKIAKTRTLVFSENTSGDNTNFYINGEMVDMQKINQIMTLNTVEEWKLINDATEVHSFHIHINPFQIISINGKPVAFTGYRDTVSIPAGGEVVVRTKYKDFTGKFVLHCHILFHEDHGMMQIVEIVPNGGESAPDNGVPDREVNHMEMNHM